MTLSLAVLIASHNRREATLECLSTLYSQSLFPTSLSVFLVDDGSTDGTADSVRTAFPHVTVIEGDGSLYWCQGMEVAWREALALGYDGYLWLNDDVELYGDAFSVLLSSVEHLLSTGDWPAVLVGSLCDPRSGALTYGGVRLTSSWRPARVARVKPSQTQLLPVDTFNGNFVFVPQGVVDVVGTLDAFSHAIGDLDYGLRVRKAGFPVYLLPGYVGSCVDPPRPPLTLSTINLPKGLPWRDWLRYTWRHARGPGWPLVFAAPYVKAAGRSIRSMVRSSLQSR